MKKQFEQPPKAQKKWGQHYLVDQNIQIKICSDHLSSAEAIIEVGPGPGALTQHLAKHPLPFWVIETDERFQEGLEKLLPSDKIFFVDALAFNWPSFLLNSELIQKKVWLVSNLPYNISVPLLLQFIQIKELHFLTLMFQKEVADKIAPQIGEMNSLHVLTNSYFTIKKLAHLSPRAFRPPPKVDSLVLSLIRRDIPIIPLDEFSQLEKFGRKLFSFRRKQLQKVLREFYSLTQLTDCFKSSGISPTERAHNLSYEKVLALYHTLAKK